MININNTLYKLNILNFRKSQNNIKILMNIIKNDNTATKSFIAENIFISSILSIIIIFVILNKTIKSFIKISKIMQLNNVKVVTASNVQ